MILAGGLSTRLYPLTKTVPKPLVPVLGEPNIAHVIRYLKGFGITEIATNVFYFADDVRAALGDGSAYGVALTYLDEPSLSGSAGAVKLMESFLAQSDPFVVVGCDDLTDLDLPEQIALHRERNAIATIGLVERNDVREYGVVVVAQDGRIVGFQEKPQAGEERSNLVNTGIYVFSPEIFTRIPSGEVYDFGKQAFPELQRDEAPFYGYKAPNAYWCDIGTIPEYHRVTDDLLRGTFALPAVDPNHRDRTAHISADAHIEGAVWIGAGASIGQGARITGPSVIGERAVVGANARLEQAILWPSARIGEGATLSRSIVGSAFAVAAGERVADAVLAADADVGKVTT